MIGSSVSAIRFDKVALGGELAPSIEIAEGVRTVFDSPAAAQGTDLLLILVSVPESKFELKGRKLDACECPQNSG